eukprot:4807347-Amphidinium_carterae.1
MDSSPGDQRCPTKCSHFWPCERTSEGGALKSFKTQADRVLFMICAGFVAYGITPCRLSRTPRVMLPHHC